MIRVGFNLIYIIIIDVQSSTFDSLIFRTVYNKTIILTILGSVQIVVCFLVLLILMLKRVARLFIFFLDVVKKGYTII